MFFWGGQFGNLKFLLSLRHPAISWLFSSGTTPPGCPQSWWGFHSCTWYRICVPGCTWTWSSTRPPHTPLHTPHVKLSVLPPHAHPRSQCCPCQYLQTHTDSLKVDDTWSKDSVCIMGLWGSGHYLTTKINLITSTQKNNISGLKGCIMTNQSLQWFMETFRP